MKVTIHHPDADFEWDTSMGDDHILVNQIARDVAEVRFSPQQIIRRYVDAHQHAMDYECPVCAANEKTNVSPEQTGLFEDEQAPE